MEIITIDDETCYQYEQDIIGYKIDRFRYLQEQYFENRKF